MLGINDDLMMMIFFGCHLSILLNFLKFFWFVDDLHQPTSWMDFSSSWWRFILFKRTFLATQFQCSQWQLEVQGDILQEGRNIAWANQTLIIWHFSEGISKQDVLHTIDFIWRPSLFDPQEGGGQYNFNSFRLDEDNYKIKQNVRKEICQPVINIYGVINPLFMWVIKHGGMEL